MLINVSSFINYATIVSMIIALFSLIFSIITWIKMNRNRKIQTTVEYFNIIQIQVFDALESVIEKNNALYIVESLEDDNEKSPEIYEAYNAYRVLIARLEHFSVGISKKIYDFKTVDKLAGLYLLDLFDRIEPIIDKVNEDYVNNEYYNSFVKLIHRLEKRHPDRLLYYYEYEEAATK